MSTSQIILKPEPLTAEAFRPYGDVIEVGAGYGLINDGTTKKFADLARIDVAAEGGRPCVSIYQASPYELPLEIRMLERHPLGSQFFMPLNTDPFLIVVAPASDTIEPSSACAFITNGRQGINYHRGTWHHPLIALGSSSEFLVVDRGGRGRNCDEQLLEGTKLLLENPP